MTKQSIHINDKVIITLYGAPSTGFKWITYYLEGNAVLQDGEPDYEKDDGTHNGKGGYYNFYYRGFESGESDIKLVYAQHWNDDSLTSYYTLTINID